MLTFNLYLHMICLYSYSCVIFGVVDVEASLTPPQSAFSSSTESLDALPISVISTMNAHNAIRSADEEILKVIGSEEHSRVVALWKERILEAVQEFSEESPFPRDVHLYLLVPFSVYSPRVLHHLTFVLCCDSEQTRPDLLGGGVSLRTRDFLTEIHNILEVVFEGISLDIQVYKMETSAFESLSISLLSPVKQIF